MRSLLLAAASVLVVAPALAAQTQQSIPAKPQSEAERAKVVAAQPRPKGWAIRYDRANAVDTAFKFADMPPGFHVTSGPAAILWHADKTAKGNFAVESEIYLFKGEDRPEGYGVFVGGEALNDVAQRYTYFLLRKDGMFTIRQRQGAEVKTLMPWTAHAAVPAGPTEPGKPVQAKLRVEAGAQDVAFLVNGTRVAALPRAQVQPDGIAGLRVNHALNLHVTSLDVKPLP